MKSLLLCALLLATTAFAQDQKPAPPSTLKGILLEQLKTTHDKNDWFVSPSKSVEGLTPEQASRSEEHTSELQSHVNLVCRLLLEKKKPRCTAEHSSHGPTPYLPAPPTPLTRPD